MMTTTNGTPPPKFAPKSPPWHGENPWPESETPRLAAMNPAARARLLLEAYGPMTPYEFASAAGSTVWELTPILENCPDVTLDAGRWRFLTAADRVEQLHAETVRRYQRRHSALDKLTRERRPTH